MADRCHRSENRRASIYDCHANYVWVRSAGWDAGEGFGGLIRHTFSHLAASAAAPAPSPARRVPPRPPQDAMCGGAGAHGQAGVRAVQEVRREPPLAAGHRVDGEPAVAPRRGGCPGARQVPVHALHALMEGGGAVPGGSNGDQV